MNILYRNFIKLLSIGAFDANENIELMSEYKWNKLLLLSNRCNAQEFIFTGICKVHASNDMLIPQSVYNKIENNIPQEAQTVQPKETLPTAKQEKKFSNIYLNKKYNKLVFDEIHSIDTSVESLAFINKLIDNINTILNSSLDFKLLADLGFYLRVKGDKIDFIKIENWIKALRLKKICNLVCYFLILSFKFEPEELPFMKGIKTKNLYKIDKRLERNLLKTPPLGHDQTNKANVLNPMGKFSTHPMKYISYCPLESTSRVIANIMKSLSNIDE